MAYFVAWEFVFRGWMLFGLAPRLGPGLAIVLQALPFSLMHTGKPELEAYGLILAGLALGALAWRTRIHVVRRGAARPGGAGDGPLRRRAPGGRAALLSYGDTSPLMTLAIESGSPERSGA